MTFTHLILPFQMICDADLLITNVVALWPGSAHDARIFRSCTLSQRLELGSHTNMFIKIVSKVALLPFYLCNLNLLHFCSQVNSQD